MCRLQLGAHGREERLGLLGGDDALLHQPRDIQLSHGRLLRDLLHHQRLCVGRLVLLVVPEAAVSDQVDDDVVPELLPVRERKPNRGDRRLRIVRVDVDDRDVEPLGKVARVARRPALVRVGREADLVVGDQVERAARRVAVEVRQVQRLGHDPLAGERRVTVNQNRERHGGVVDALATGA